LLDRLAAAAQSCNGLRIAIEGHTDTEGSARYNKSLSVRRARVVQDYLLKTGMRSQQLEAIGYGYARPAAPNDTPENMAKNRRIEFVIRR
jgi:OOP family OmpA-OmpF porin